jgi:PII-like signaling protein
MSYVHSAGGFVRVFVSEDDCYHGSRLYRVILGLAHDMNLAGATVLRGVEGFGASSTVHSERNVRMSEDLPMVVTVADTWESLEPFVAKVEAVLADADVGGFIAIDHADLVFPGSRQPRIEMEA